MIKGIGQRIENARVKAKFMADRESKHRSVSDSMKIYKRGESSICRWRIEAGWETNCLKTEHRYKLINMIADPGLGRKGEHAPAKAKDVAKKHDVSVQTVYRTRHRIGVLRYLAPKAIKVRRIRTFRRPSFNRHQRAAQKIMNAWHRRGRNNELDPHLEALRD